jgi:hypothetical protein
MRMAEKSCREDVRSFPSLAALRTHEHATLRRANPALVRQGPLVALLGRTAEARVHRRTRLGITLADVFGMPFDFEDPQASAFYERGLRALASADVPFLVGGGYAFSRYTAIDRPKKDLDLYLRERDMDRALAAMQTVSTRTELTFPHWLGKAYDGEHFIDFIHNSGNGVAPVDDDWFTFANEDMLFAQPVWLTPREEMIWSKAFVMERERCDAADVLHLLRGAEQLDWQRLVRRFGAHHRVLYAHLVLFGFVYPSERTRIPQEVLDALAAAVAREQQHSEGGQVCQGTLLSREQYLVDVTQWGFEDARLSADSHMTEEQIAQWTRAIAQETKSDDDLEPKHTNRSAG